MVKVCQIEIMVIEPCIKLLVPNVEMNVKFHLSPLKADRSTAKSVIEIIEDK